MFINNKEGEMNVRHSLLKSLFLSDRNQRQTREKSLKRAAMRMSNTQTKEMKVTVVFTLFVVSPFTGIETDKTRENTNATSSKTGAKSTCQSS